ncbi:hypothetical protein AB0M43_14810 [Longispora sp. NPDC051575]|uniref:hypothetical protein n=1 Tax=Longispora sp. NPDC051575 TaxID=3154943 RepID=UPI00341AEA2E
MDGGRDVGGWEVAVRVSLEVRFVPGTVPVRCFRFVRDRLDGPDLETSEIAMAGRDAAHVLASGAPPGIVGLRWDWE